MQNAAERDQPAAEAKKIKISFEELRKLAFTIIAVMKEFESKGEDNVRQGDVIDQAVQKLDLESQEHSANVDRAAETAKKINHVINYLVNKENILMISQDARTKHDRYLTLNVNVDLDNLAGFLTTGREGGQ